MPVRIDRFEEVDASVFDEYPRPTGPGKKVDPQWEELLTKLDQGSVIRLPLGDETELRGLRLALGRRAAGRGFRVETRNDGRTLVIRKSDRPLKPDAEDQAAAGVDPWVRPATGGRKRGRPRKQDQQSATVDGGTYAQNEAVAEGFA